MLKLNVHSSPFKECGVDGDLLLILRFLPIFSSSVYLVVVFVVVCHCCCLSLLLFVIVVVFVVVVLFSFVIVVNSPATKTAKKTWE